MISVIIPIYNASNYLPTCLDSVLSQTFKDFELILINDGSDDDSGEICKQYSKIDSRIKVINKLNGGEASARNLGIKEAKGEYIAFIDADDYLEPKYLEILYTAIKLNDSDLAICNFHEVWDRLNCHQVLVPKFTILTQSQLIKGLYSSVEFMTAWCKLYKTKLLKDSFFIDYPLGLDVEFNSRIYLKTKKIVYIPLCLYYWLQHAGSVTRNKFSIKNIESIDSYLKAYQNMPSYIPLYRAYALQRLYKVVLYTHYNCPKKFKKILKKKEYEIIKISCKEFLNSRLIPLKMKSIFMIFYFFPFSYKIFRKIKEI